MLCLFGLTYIHPYPQHIATTYGYSQTLNVEQTQLISALTN